MLWVTMYVTLTDIQNGEPVYLASVPATACGGLEVALCELMYYHRWLNIGAALENNQVSTGRTTLKIPHGYYNACELDDVLQPLGAKLRLHAPTGHLKLSAEKRLVLNRQLADLLGFSRDTFEPGKTYTADEPHRLAVYREICVHLPEISTTENLHNGAPSTLLRSVPIKNEGFSANARNIRPCEPNTTYNKKCLTLVALGAPENAQGWLWLILGIPQDSRRMGRRDSCMASSCPTGCTNEKRSSPKREVGRRSLEG